MPDLRGFVNRGPLLEQVAKLLRPSLAELPLLLDFLEAEGYGPFGLCGISFGGLLAYAAPQYEPRLRTIAAILADPGWCAPYDRLDTYRGHLTKRKKSYAKDLEAEQDRLQSIVFETG